MTSPSASTGRWSSRSAPVGAGRGAGAGRVAAASRDTLGDTLGSFSSFAIDQSAWRKRADGSYSGVLLGLPDRGYNSDTLKTDFVGCRAWIISSNLEAYKHIGFKANGKHTLYNGQLECRYAGFDLYEGSIKDQA